MEEQTGLRGPATRSCVTPALWPAQAKPPTLGMTMRHMAPSVEKAEQEMHQKPFVCSFSASKRRFHRHQQGFSLIEILVVISIIALILGVGAAVALRVTAEARREQTRTMMEGLIGANTEHKAVRGSNISHTGIFNGETLSTSERFVASCLQVQTCEEIMLGALNSSTSQALDRIYKNEGGSGNYNGIYDRWGTELEYRSSNNQNGTGPQNENGNQVANNLLPISRDPFFASAGPDKEWGTDDDITTID